LSDNESIAKGLLKGIPVSEGIAIGKVWILESPWDEVVERSVDEEKLDTEIQRYKSAFTEVAQQLAEFRDRVQKEIGPEEAKIFMAHLSILNDTFFKEEILALIKSKHKNAEYLLQEGIERLGESFAKLDSEYFRHRIDDVRDVATRLLRALLKSEGLTFPIGEPSILVAHTLNPSDTARVDREHILGFATELGGETSHASIVARSMGLPAVVGVEKLMKQTRSGDTVIVDGNSGIVYIDPPQRVIKGYQKRQKQFDVYWKRLSEDIALPAVTADDVEISLQANISMTADVSLAVRYQADNVGLFRTELPFLIAGKLLSEDEQFKIYQTIVQAMKGKPVTIRTLDLGGDKFLPFQDVEKEHNPFLGWRSIRISLQEVDVFKAQIRAILRASHFGKVRILFPMISSLEEVIDIRVVFEKTMEELGEEGIPFDDKIPFGIMVEVPSTAVLIDRFMEHVDFVSIGTNDLIQYTLAVDRNNERVAKFYKPTNPAILRLIEGTIHASNSAKKSISLCGEMAGNPLYTALLLGFGLRQFSMSPLMLPEVKERVRAITILECEELAEHVLQMDSAEKIDYALWEFHHRVNKRQTVPYLEKADQLNSS
jgi:phosphotransferase system enzyme I (PtsI)